MDTPSICLRCFGCQILTILLFAELAHWMRSVYVRGVKLEAIVLLTTNQGLHHDSLSAN